MIPLGLEFPASLGGEDGFFDRANYYMQQGMLRLLANMHKSNKRLNPVYSSVHHLWLEGASTQRVRRSHSILISSRRIQ